MHYYQFNIGDYSSHTGYLSLLEDLAYRRLLDTYYLSEAPYPGDPKKVARLIGMRDNVEEVTQVLQDFFVLEDGLYHNKRVDQEIELYHSKAVTARNNGRKGGRPKKPDVTQPKPNPNPEETQSVNLANPEITGSQANHKPLTINQEPLTKKHVNNTPIGSYALQDSWKPDKTIWEGKAFQAGLLNTDYNPFLTEFICHYQNQRAQTEVYWIGKLISWIKRAPAAKQIIQPQKLSQQELEELTNEVNQGN